MTRVLYIASQLPRRSETFVYREFFALRAAGVQVRAATLYPPDRGLGEPRLEALAAEAVAVYGLGAARLLADAARELLAHPGKALGTLALAARDALTAPDLAPAARARLPGQALAALALARRVRALAPDHLHAHFAHSPATLAMYAARQLGRPFSFTGHAVDLFRDRALLAAKLRRARFVNCISEWHRGFYQAIAPRPERDYPVVRCGVDLAEFAPAGREPGAPPMVLGVGRLVPKKGFDVLLRAAARLKAEGVAARVRIAGDGPEKTALAGLRARLGLERDVELLGACANQRVRELLKEADLFVLPCRVDREGDRDGIPVVLMEAMAAGVCVVSGDLPTIRELVADEKTGRMTPPGDEAALASAMGELLRDPARRRELAAAGRARTADEFSLEVNRNRMLACLAM